MKHKAHFQRKKQPGAWQNPRQKKNPAVGVLLQKKLTESDTIHLDPLNWPQPTENNHSAGLKRESGYQY